MKTHLLLVVVVAACSSKGDESKSSGSSAGGSGSGAGEAQTAGAKRPLDCDQVFPQAVRDAYTHGAPVKNIKKPVSDNGGCEFKVGDKNASIDVLCDDSSWAARENSMKILHEMGAGYTAEDVAIGKGATVVSHSVSQQLTAWDDDSNCVVTVSLTPPGGLDLQALARDLVKAMPPAGRSKALPAVKAACKLTGSCSRCKDSKDCTGGETCITYQKGANHYSGCVDGRDCSVGDIMMQGDTLCGTKNKMD